MSRARRLEDLTPPDVPPGADAPPPAPPRELAPDPEDVVALDVDGVAWIARFAGKGAGGTGSYGLGMVDAVHFALADAPARPLREALIERGRFVHLFDDELRGLFERSRPIVEREAERTDPSGPGRGRG